MLIRLSYNSPNLCKVYTNLQLRSITYMYRARALPEGGAGKDLIDHKRVAHLGIWPGLTSPLHEPTCAHYHA